MRYSIAFIDVVFLLSLLSAFFILIFHRKRHLQYDIGLIVTALLIFNFLYGLCLFLEWAGITQILESYEDLTGAMLPMIWAFFFYAILQNIAGSALKKSEDRYRRLFEESNDLIVIHKIGNIIDVNQKMCDVLGYRREQLLNMSIQDLYSEEFSEYTADRIERIKENKSYIFEAGIVKADGNLLDVEISASIIDPENNITQGIIRDISKRKQAEEEKKLLEQKLRQTQKMEAIGTLAGGIAHDFNNILSIIFGFIELAQMDIDSPEKITSDLDELKEAALRAKELIKQILTISRQTEQERQPLRISLVISEALKLLRSTIPTSIEIKNESMSQSNVLADATQIHQIIMNLCTNAYHAMGDTGGVMGVSVKDILISGEDIVIGSRLKPGKYIRIEVSDTGHGMDEKTRERIFEPYFTTKKMGEGTGLGLAVVHGIVESHDGVINVYSEPGVGTSFHIYLPVFKGKLIPVENLNHIQYNLRGSERILYVDDEKTISDIADDALGRYGYKVSVFHSSINALEEFKKNPSGYDLIITDMTMPGMNGLDLTEKVREIRHDVPVILCSGYSKLISLQKIKEMGIQFVNKPIIMSEMIRKIRLTFEKGRYDG